MNQVFIILNNFLLCLQKGAGFLEEHVYMAGDHTIKGMWLWTLAKCTLSYDEQVLSLYAFS